MKSTIIVACIFIAAIGLKVGFNKTSKRSKQSEISITNLSIKYYQQPLQFTDSSNAVAIVVMQTNLPPGYTWLRNDEGSYAFRNSQGAQTFAHCAHSEQHVIEYAWRCYDENPEEHTWHDVPEEISPKPPVTPMAVQTLESLLPRFGIQRNQSNQFNVVMIPPGMTNWTASDMWVTNRTQATQAIVNLMRTMEQKYDAAKRDLEWADGK